MILLNKIDVTVQQNPSTSVFELIVESSDGNQHNVQLLITDQSNSNVVYNNTFTVNPPEIVPLNFGAGTYLLSFDIDGESAYVLLTISGDLSSEPIIDPWGGIIAIIAGYADNKFTTTYRVQTSEEVTQTFRNDNTNNNDKVEYITPKDNIPHEVDVSELTSGHDYTVLYTVPHQGNPEFRKT